MANAPTKALAVLDFIKSTGSEGARLKDIQTFIMRMNGKIGPTEERPNSARGYWCDYLVGHPHFTQRYPLLHQYCDKNENGRWVLKETPPASDLRLKKTKNYTDFHKREKERYEAWAKCLPRCPHCKHPISEMPFKLKSQWKQSSHWAPDLKACVSSWSLSIEDCKGRVWTRSGKLTNLTRTQVDKLHDHCWKGDWQTRDERFEKLITPHIVKEA